MKLEPEAREHVYALYAESSFPIIEGTNESNFTVSGVK